MAQGTPALGCHQRRGTFPAAGAPDPSAMAHGRSGKAGSGMRAVVSQALCPRSTTAQCERLLAPDMLPTAPRVCRVICRCGRTKPD